jgi:hypothetical protein
MEITIKSYRAPLTSIPSWLVSFDGSPEEIQAVEEPVTRIIQALSNSKTPVISELESKHEPSEPVTQ